MGITRIPSPGSKCHFEVAELGWVLPNWIRCCFAVQEFARSSRSSLDHVCIGPNIPALQNREPWTRWNGKEKPILLPAYGHRIWFCTFNVKKQTNKKKSSPTLLSVELISVFLPSVKDLSVWKAGEGYPGFTIVHLTRTPIHTCDKVMAITWWGDVIIPSRSVASQKEGEDLLPCHWGNASINFSGCSWFFSGEVQPPSLSNCINFLDIRKRWHPGAAPTFFSPGRFWVF